MKYPSLALTCLVLALSLPGSATAQTSPTQKQGMDHSARMDHTATIRSEGSMPTEVGQSAFAAIAEIVKILRADPKTDWGKVDIGALRQHLIDMNNVTLRATVNGQTVEGGARYDVTSDALEVTASIRRMVIAHAATMSGVDGIRMEAAEIPAGARLSVTGPNAEMIRGLGFIGLMTLGMHHQAHHLALARGIDPHKH
jgi:hypothetical protein